jgi:transcriptional regulator with XRE-family HTH domain
VRALRLQQGLSQIDMVRDHGFDLSQFQRIERGAVDPRLSTVLRLARCFDLTLSAFLEGVAE